MHNGKMLEYSLLFRYPIEYLVNIEVKTMRCDPFEKEDNLDIHTVKDGTVLIKQLINEDFTDLLYGLNFLFVAQI